MQDGPGGFQGRNRGFEPIKDAVHTITTDNGPEVMQYEDIEKSLGCSVYYTHPHCPWQKGAVENLNMLIR